MSVLHNIQCILQLPTGKDPLVIVISADREGQSIAPLRPIHFPGNYSLRCLCTLVAQCGPNLIGSKILHRITIHQSGL